MGARPGEGGPAGEGAWWERAFNSAATKRERRGGGGGGGKKGKKRGREGEGAGRHRDGVGTTATADEMAIAARLAADPWGRFGRSGAKLARIREQEQSGLASGAGRELAEAQAVGAGALHDGTRVEGSAAAGKRRRTGDAGAPSAPPKRTRARVVVELPGDARAVAHAAGFVPTVLAGWWGAKWFAAAGLLEGLSQKTQTYEEGFKMADQEKLYMRAQFQRNRGGTGLGSSGRDLPKANLGKDWAGSKKTDFADPAAGPGLPGAASLMGECAKALGSAKKGKLKLAKLEAKVFKSLGLEASAARSSAFEAFVQDAGGLRLKKGKVAKK